MAFRARPALPPARWLGPLVVALLLLLVGAVAQAESPDDERARAHFVAAHAYFEEQRFAEAAREFQEAYVLSGRPEMLLNKSRAEERAGDLEGAASSLALLLERHPQTAYRPEAESHLAELRAQLPPEPERGGTPPPPAPPPPSEPKAAPEPVKEPLWKQRAFRYGLLGATGATALIAVATGWAAHAKYRDLERGCDGGCSDAELNLRDRGQRLARTSTVFTFAALALGSATAALFVLDWRTRRTKAELSFHSSPLLQHATLRFTYRGL